MRKHYEKRGAKLVQGSQDKARQYDSSRVITELRADQAIELGFAITRMPSLRAISSLLPAFSLERSMIPKDLFAVAIGAIAVWLISIAMVSMLAGAVGQELGHTSLSV